MMESRQQSNSLAAGIHLLKGRKKFVPQCSYVCHLDTFTVVKDCLVYHLTVAQFIMLFSTLCLNFLALCVILAIVLPGTMTRN